MVSSIWVLAALFSFWRGWGVKVERNLSDWYDQALQNAGIFKMQSTVFWKSFL